LFIIKFIAGLFIFGNINSLGYYREGFAFSGGFLWTLGLSALFAVSHPTIAHIIVLLAAMIQISLSLELTLIIFLLGVCIIIFYCRLQPQKSMIIFAMILGYYFKIPYAVVLIAGLYAGFAAIPPVAVSTAVWSFLPLFTGIARSVPGSQTLALEQAGFDARASADSITEIYLSIYTQFSTDFQWIFNAFIFAMVIILVYAISKLTINYAKEIGIILGGIVCILGVFMSSNFSGQTVQGGAGIFVSILLVLLSVILAIIFRFFDAALDYTKIRYVEFEDDDYHYHVKIINKLKTEEIVEEPNELSEDDDYLEYEPGYRRVPSSSPGPRPIPRTRTGPNPSPTPSRGTAGRIQSGAPSRTAPRETRKDLRKDLRR
jgi:hypothetical protein